MVGNGCGDEDLWWTTGECSETRLPQPSLSDCSGEEEGCKGSDRVVAIGGDAGKKVQKGEKRYDIYLECHTQTATFTPADNVGIALGLRLNRRGGGLLMVDTWVQHQLFIQDHSGARTWSPVSFTCIVAVVIRLTINHLGHRYREVEEDEADKLAGPTQRAVRGSTMRPLREACEMDLR